MFIYEDGATCFNTYTVGDEEDQELDGLSDEGRSQPRDFRNYYGRYQNYPAKTSRFEYVCGTFTDGRQNYCSVECRRTGICVNQLEEDRRLQSNDLVDKLQQSINELAESNHKLQLSLESANKRYVKLVNSV